MSATPSKKYFKTVFKKRKVSVFMVFFFFAVILWFLTKLSANYDSTISLNIHYYNVPQDKLLLNNSATTLKAVINAKGFALLGYKLHRKEVNVNLSNASHKGGKYYFTGTKLNNAISEDFSRNVTVRSVLKDSLVVNLGVNIEKDVPVVADVHLNFTPDFAIYDSLKISPDTIRVHGPQNMIDTLTRFKTEPLTLNNVSENISKTLKIVIPKQLSKLTFDKNQVDVSAKVERFSEKVYIVAVKVLNVPKGLTIRTFPSEVKILCKAAIKDFKNISADDFEVECDYESIKNKPSATFMIPEITSASKFAKEVTLQQKKVDFLIKKDDE
ncbi:CdaR family protein [Zhouia sp. PK063]|uniref:CdaR family protein n=1 Tax=Zhouia sp. PK063 TaxID=3373602 RepID=UPI0037A389EA